MRISEIVGRAALVLAVAACWVPISYTGFFDDIYYRGPQSAHFNGERFFNPDGEFGTGGTRKAGPGRFLRFAMGSDRTPWPASVPVTPAHPAQRVHGTTLKATWVGHATVLLQTNGLNILTDPIWSQRASPFSFTGPKRVRAPGVAFDDLPPIDLVLISHNHYDHMDIATLKRLWERDHPLIITSLGNDTLLRRAGIRAQARDWGESIAIAGGDQPGDVVVERVHHWDSRWMADRNRALWSGFTLRLPGGPIFFAGDTGLGDDSWPKQAARHGPFRFAIIPIGAFRPRELMSGNHIGPVEAVHVFRELNAGNALAVHWGTFQLSSEGVDEPRQVLRAELRRNGIASDRFRATEAGETIDIPPLQPAETPEP